MSFLNGVSSLCWNNKMFLIEKLSAIHCTKFNVISQSICSRFIVEYVFELDFSGSVMRLQKNGVVDMYSEEERKKGFFAKKKVNPHYEFLNKYFHKIDGFKLAYYETDRKRDTELKLVGDYNRWFAECSGTVEALDKLKKDIEFVMNFIDEHRKF